MLLSSSSSRCSSSKAVREEEEEEAAAPPSALLAACSASSASGRWSPASATRTEERVQWDRVQSEEPSQHLTGSLLPARASSRSVSGRSKRTKGLPWLSCCGSTWRRSEVNWKPARTSLTFTLGLRDRLDTGLCISTPGLYSGAVDAL